MRHLSFAVAYSMWVASHLVTSSDHAQKSAQNPRTKNPPNGTRPFGGFVFEMRCCDLSRQLRDADESFQYVRGNLLFSKTQSA